MKAPGPISDIIELIILVKNKNTFHCEKSYKLRGKWNKFAKYFQEKYNREGMHWYIWCNWYLKKLKCKEILK